MKTRSHRSILEDREGIAVLVTLGLLAVVTLLVFAFLLSMRSERLVARHVLDRSQARHLLDAGLHVAVGTLNASLHQRNYPVNGWDPVWMTNGFEAYLGGEMMMTPDCLGSHDDSAGLPELEHPVGERPDPVGLFDGIVTNWIPQVLHDQAHSISSYWVHVVATNDVNETQELVGRVAFLAINCSGLVDVHHMTTNQCDALTDITDASLFYTDLERDVRYMTCADLATNRAVITPVRDLFTHSYDPGPEVYFTNVMNLGTTRAELFDRFAVNNLTNAATYADLATSTLSNKYTASQAFITDYRRPVMDRLALIDPDLDEEDLEPLLWNLVNYLDTDRVPQSDSSTPYREPFGVEDVPLINEIGLFMVDESRMAPGLSNHYEVAVEAWYPFVPRVIEDTDAASLHVGVATSAVQATAFNFDATQLGPFGFSTNLGAMAYGNETEFAVGYSPDSRLISFPVERVIDFVNAGDGTLEPRVETIFLPLGTNVSYTTSVLQGDPPLPQPVTRYVNNVVWLQSRVGLQGDQWVDEAPGLGGEGSSGAYRTQAGMPLALLDTVSLSVNDPRFNGSPDDWTASLSLATNAPSLGRINPVATPWTGEDADGGQGLPIHHADAAMTSIGEMGFLTHTSAWHSVDLMTAEGALLLDLFTAQETNTAQLGRIHLCTAQSNSMHAVLSEAVIGWSNRFQNTTRALTDDERTTLVDAVYAARVHNNSDRMLFFAYILDDIGRTAEFADWQPTNGVERAADIKEDAFRHLPEHTTFRQNIFAIIMATQSVNPVSHRTTAETRAMALVLRDAYTGRWHLERLFSLDE